VADFENKKCYEAMHGKASILTFSWMSDLIRLSRKQQRLYICDLHPVKPAQQPYNAATAIANSWNHKLIQGKSPNFLNMVFRAFKNNFIVMGCLLIFYVLSNIGSSICVQYLSSLLSMQSVNAYLTQAGGDGWEAVRLLLRDGAWMIVLVFLCQLVYALVDAGMSAALYDAGVRVISGILDLIYSKSLSMSEIARENSASGSVVNLIFGDSTKVATFVQLFTMIVTLPILMVAMLLFVGLSLNPQALSGLIGIVIFIPCMVGVMMVFTKAITRLLSYRDSRLRKVTEILNGIKVIKLFTIEDVQEARLLHARSLEVHQLNVFATIMAVLNMLGNAACPLMSVFAFLFLSISGNLNGSVAYTVIYCFEMLAILFLMLPMLLTAYTECSVASKRLQAFLNLAEPDLGVLVHNPDDHSSEIAISTSGKPSFCWGLASDRVSPPILDPFYNQNRQKRAVIYKKYNEWQASYKKQLEAFKASADWATLDDEQRYILEQGTAAVIETTTVLDRWALELELPLVNAVDSLTAYDANLFGPNASDRPYDALRRAFLNLYVTRSFYTHAVHEQKEREELRHKSAAERKAIKNAQGTQGVVTEDIQDLPATIKNLDFTIRRGELIGICGSVGSGKSTFFNGICGELRLVREQRAKLDTYRHRENFLVFDYPRSPEVEERIRYPDGKDPYSDPEIPHIYINGTVAYFTQTAVIFSGTVRDNICFHRPYDEEKYNHVVDICCLKPDFELLDKGDLTELGDKGANLSGGQKARIAFARAVYSDSDIVLLDDPLSAVDAHVGARLWREAICDYLRSRGTTILIASHQTQYFGDCDRVMRICDGEITHLDTPQVLDEAGVLHGMTRVATRDPAQGSSASLDELASRAAESVADIQSLSGLGSAESVPAIAIASADGHAADMSSAVPKVPHKQVAGSMPPRRKHVFPPAAEGGRPPAGPGRKGGDSLGDQGEQDGQDNQNTLASPDSPVPISKEAEQGAADRKANVELTVNKNPAGNTESLSGSGSISGASYKAWVQAGGTARLLLCVLVTLLWQGATQYLNVYVSSWAEDEFGLSNGAYIGIYIGIAVVTMLLSFAMSYLLALFCIHASHVFHNRMVHSLLHTHLSFFDITPQGRIVNRMSKDIDSMDSAILRSLSGAVNSAASFIGMVVVICVMAWPAIFVLIVCAIIYVILFREFRRITPQLKRLDSITRSPVYALVGETMNALPVVRAYRQETVFHTDFRTKAHINVSAFWYAAAIQKWLGFRLNIVSCVLAVCIALIVVIIAPFGEMSRYAGLVLSYGFNVTSLLTNFVTSFVMTEGEMASVERVLEYTKLESEGALTKKCTNLEKIEAEGGRWPRPGVSGIKIENLVFRYRKELDPTLRGMNFTIEPRSHVGVVGRTGAGKSSITVAMFRLAEPDPGSHIYIDGIDILNDVGLHQARKALAIIPQEPFLFSGTLRCSLCPYSQAEAEGITPPAGLERIPDDVLWRVLDQVRLKEYFQKQPGGLDCKIAAGGENLSAGQRQLVCVARALVRNASCVILDEATACVDRENDKLIQETIRTALADTTVFSIAHRLDTIIDFDKVLVVDAGHVAEYDTPANLLRNQDSIFSGLVNNTGEEMAEKLRSAAFLAEEQRARGEAVRVALDE